MVMVVCLELVKSRESQSGLGPEKKLDRENMSNQELLYDKPLLGTGPQKR
jgi:hypothetical protein